MPTGYTAAVGEGATFEQYAMACARAFGALITMRDEPNDAPIPERFEVSDYHLRVRQEQKAEYERIAGMSEAEADTAAQAEFDSEVASRQGRDRERTELRAKYEAMLAQVEAWKPPTAEHRDYHAFMASQLRQSIDFDCREFEQTPPERLSGRDWQDQRTASLLKSIQYHTEGHAKEVAAAEGRTRWVAALRAALKTGGDK